MSGNQVRPHVTQQNDQTLAQKQTRSATAQATTVLTSGSRKNIRTVSKIPPTIPPTKVING